MNSKANWLSFFFILMSLNYTNACTCEIFGHPFCAVVGSGHRVILAEVIDQPGPHDIEIDIIENIHSDIQEDTIKILGQDGLNCGAEMNQFAIGDTLILGIFKFQTQDAMTGEVYEYYLDGCNHNFLRYSEGMVSGSINYGSSSASYEDFKNGITDCLSATLGISENLGNSSIQSFPNPINDVLNLVSEDIVMSGMSIYDIKGKKVYDKNNLDLKRMHVDLGFLDAGIYIAQIKTARGILVQKLSKL